MTWFKIDDSFHSHPKVLATPPAALGLWTIAGAWCSANLTDGFVPDYVLGRLLPDGESLAAELVASGLWRRARRGFQFHDWHDFNPTAEAEREKRRIKAEAGRKGGLASAKTRSKRRSTVEAPASALGNEADEARPDPTRSYGSVDAKGAGGNARDEPPSKCTKHATDPNPPPCRACGDARRAHDAWRHRPAPELPKFTAPNVRHDAVGASVRGAATARQLLTRGDPQTLTPTLDGRDGE